MCEKLACKGFTSTPRYDIEGKVIYGTIDEIDGFASYEAKRADGVETAFRNAVDDYIDACGGIWRRPETQAADAGIAVRCTIFALWFRFGLGLELEPSFSVIAKPATVGASKEKRPRPWLFTQA